MYSAFVADLLTQKTGFLNGIFEDRKKTTWGNKDNMFIFLGLKWNNAWPWIKSGGNVIFTFVMKRLNVNFREKTNTIILLPVKLIWPCMVVIEARVQEKGTRREGIRNEKLNTPNTIHFLLSSYLWLLGLVPPEYFALHFSCYLCCYPLKSQIISNRFTSNKIF